MKVLKATCFKQLKRFYSFYSCVLPKVIFTLAIAITFKALGSENAGILSYPKTSTNTSFNIQLSPVSYQAAGEELVFLDKDPAAPKTPEELRIIQANKLVREKLNQFFQRSNYRDLLFSYFPGKRTAIDAEFDAKAIQLREAILNHGFHVPVQLLNWQIINSAMAAFSAHGPTGSPVIYFNEDYVAGKASFIFPEANDRQIVGLLLQEYGHAIDFYLNGDNDTPGDEGALFAAKEMGFELSQIDIDGAKIRDDQNRIYVYGKEIEVEEAALVVQTIWPATISSNKVTINGSKTAGSNFRFETVCTGGGTNCTFAGTSGGGNNTVVDFTYKTTGGTITTAVRGELSWRDQSSNPNSVFFNQYSTGSTVSNSGYVVVLLVNATTNAYTSTTQISGNSGPVGSALDAFAVSNTPTTGNSVISASPTTGVIANNTNSSTITVTAKNSSNVAIAGATVTLNQFSDSGLLVPTTRTTISPASTTTDANGVATFTITSTIAPHTTYYQATVVASGFETILSNSASIGFVTGPVSKLQVLMPGETADPGSATGKTGTPTDQVAGSNVTVTVNAVDDWWNKVNTSTPTVAITTSDANAVRPSNAALTAGTGTFTLSFRTAGTQTVTATDQAGSSPLTANTGSNTLVTAGTVNKLQVLMPGETAAPGTASGKTGTPTAQTAGTSLNFTVNAVDPYWNVVSSATPTAVITSSDAQATLPSSSALSSGTKQFALTFKTTGNQTITATDQAATLTANTGSSTVVNSGAANAGMSTLTPTSASIVANGTSTQVLTVTAKDAFGNSISSGGSTVTITKSSGSGTISSVTDNNNGTYTATVTSPIVVGSGVFVATLGGSSVNNGTGSQTQSTVNYITAPASKLVITSISQQTAGSSFAVTVTLTDDNGNAVNATADGTVTLTLKTGTGTLGGTLTGTITSGTSSVTISGVTYTKAESGVVLTATGSGSGNVSGKTGDSNAFNVVAGTATKYLVTSSGYSPVAGATVTISAQLADANNNPVSTNGQTVNWTKSDANGSFASASTTTNASGIATVVLTTHTVAGTATTVTATTSSITGTSPTITTVAGTATKYLVTS
ncbi:beta strand repeat-containing protein, partial [Aquirufa rosea]